MSRIGGTQTNVGVGIEGTAGTAVSASVYPKWLDFSMQAIVEKSLFQGQRGVRNESSNSMIKRKYSKGAISFVPNVKTIVPFIYGALGTLSSSSVSDSAYTHTVTVQNASASMKSLTLIAERGGEVTERFANVVVNQFNLDVSDDYAKVTCDLIGGYPDTSTLSESFSQETEFAYHQLALKFGDSLSNAASASATPMRSFTLNIDNQVSIDDAFLFGSNTPVAGGFTAGPLKVTGSYTLSFNGTAELDAYKANTKNALIAEFTGGLIGSTSTEKLTFKLGRLVLTSEPLETTIGGLTMIKQDFQVEYDATDKEITAVVVNAVASY